MAKKQIALAKTLATSPSYEKSSLSITLNRWTLGLFLLVLLSLIGLSAITLYNLINDPSQYDLGDDLAFRQSSSIREQEQAKLIQLDQDRLQQLQRENEEHKKNLDALDKQLNSLAPTIASLLAINKEIDLRLSADPNSPVAQSPYGSSAQTGNSLKGPATLTPGSSFNFDPNQGRAYSNRFTQLVSDLDNLNKFVQNDRYNLAALDIQVQSYQKALAPQTKNLLDNESGRLAQLTGTSSGKDISAPHGVPVNGIVTSVFGVRWSPFVSGTRQMHYGLDLACPQGTPVLSTKDGIVTYTGYDPGYGNRVEVTHVGGWLTLYGHNSQILVKVGQVVRKGDVLALSGSTGASTGPHVHYEIHQNGIAIDPLKEVGVPLTYGQ